MNRIRGVLHRFAGLFRRRTIEAELSEELRGHLEELIERKRAAGMSSDDARYAALREFGPIAQIEERARDERRSVWGEQVWQDLRYSVRALRKTPAFTLTAVLTLALGIGVNAALFIAYNAAALSSLPVRDPEALVKIFGEESRGGAFLPNFSYPEYLDYRDSTQALSGIAAINEAQAFLNDTATKAPDPLLSGREPGSVSVAFVSDNYFDVLGTEMRLGRTFLPEENRAPGAAAVAVLSHLFWETHFSRDPNVLGKTVSLGRGIYTVVGVTTAEFTGHHPAPPAMWIPLMMWSKPENYEKRDVGAFRLIGRLRPGVTEAQAKADLDVIAARVAQLHPRTEAKNFVRLERGMRLIDIPLNARTVAAMTPVVLGFALVLVIACTNVANLLLARGVKRQQEIGVRLTLGASRGRIVRQLLVENLLLCTIAAVVGVVLAVWTLEILRPLILSELPADAQFNARVFRFLTLGLDFRVVAFTVLMAGIAALGAGLLPALHASRADLFAAVKNDGSTFGRRLSQSRLRNLLIIAQVAVCLTLLSCAGLLVRNMIELREFDLGYNPDILFEVGQRSTPGTSIPLHLQRRAEAETLREMPAVAAACQLLGPIVSNGFTTPVKNAGGGEAVAPTEANFSFVSPDFFDTFTLPLQRGRAFGWSEIDADARVVVVGERLAQQLWPGEDAVGRTLAVSDAALAFPQRARGSGFRDYTVIGVARDIRTGIWDTARGFVYLPLTAPYAARSAIFIRPRGDSSAALGEIARAAEAQGRTLQFRRRLGDAIEMQKLPFRGLAALSGALGGLALLMAVVGLYGVMAFSVAQRSREIGIRMALGATTGKVVQHFVRQGMRLVSVGMALGLGGGVLFALLLRKIMFGLGGPFDAMAFGAVTLILGAVALLACWLPARKASRVDPMIALRTE